MKVPIEVCGIEEHDLVKYEPDLVGDGTMSVSMIGRCKKCDCVLQYYWTTKGFIYEVRIDGFKDDFPIYQQEKILVNRDRRSR